MLWPDTFVEEGSLSKPYLFVAKGLGWNPAFIENGPRGEVTALLAPSDSSRMPQSRIHKNHLRVTANWRTRCQCLAAIGNFVSGTHCERSARLRVYATRGSAQ